MRILLITEFGVQGGAYCQMMDLLREFKKYPDIEVTALVSRNRALSEKLKEIGIENYFVKYKQCVYSCQESIVKGIFEFLPRLALYLMNSRASICRTEKQIDLKTFDLVYTYINRVDIGLMIAKKYNVPHIMHVHEFGREDYKCVELRPRFYIDINNISNKVIAVSGAVKKKWAEKGVDEDKITVVYNGINQFNIEPAEEAALSQDESLRIVMLGTICRTKGQYLVVNALCRLDQSILNNIKVDLIGPHEKKYFERIKRLVIENRLENVVNFCGHTENAVKLLHKYHVGIMASRSEGFGRVTVEYMLARLGVIASNTGANLEIIKNGNTGLLFEYGNIESLRDQLLLYYGNRALLQRIACNAKKDAEERFLIKEHAEKIYRICQSVTKSNIGNEVD